MSAQTSPLVPSKGEEKSLGDSAEISQNNLHYSAHVHAEPHSHASVLSTQRNYSSFSENKDKLRETIFQDIDVTYSRKVNAIAIDSNGRFLALGGKQLNLLDMEQPDKETPFKVPSPNPRFEIGVLEWNPHSTHAGTIAFAASSEAHVLNIDASSFRSEVGAKLNLHKRTITSISWNYFDPQMLSTCAQDGFIHVWDLRDLSTSKPAKQIRSYGSAASIIQWNRHNSHVLAAAHSSEARIWDIRKETSPITSITAHIYPIAGLDWSYTKETDLLTCSQDKQVKFWSTKDPKVCKDSLQVGVPLVRARYTPFGKGVITMGKGSDDLKLWSLYDLTSPVSTYATSELISFDWRVKDVGVMAYQLAVFSRDNHLKTFCVDKITQAACKERPAQSKKQQNEFFAVDLAQEFAIVKRNGIPGVTIEELNLPKRTALVSVEHQNQSADIRVGFPELYPRNAQPSFEFLPSSTLPVTVQANLRKILSETAQLQVEHNQPCLENCLSKLVLLLKKINLNKLERPVVPNSPGELSTGSLTEHWINVNATSGISRAVSIGNDADAEPENFGPKSPLNDFDPNVVTYVVRPTDTLAGIALAHNMKLDLIKQINGIHSDKLYPGQVLYLKSPNVNTPPMSNFRKIKASMQRRRAATVTTDAEGIAKRVSAELFDKDLPRFDERLKSLSLEPIARSRSKTSSSEKKELRRSLIVSAAPKEVIKEEARYVTETFAVNGKITLTENLFFFEPNLDDPYVLKTNGLLACQLYIQLSDVFDVQMIKENPNCFYETSLEISSLKGISVSIYNFLIEELKLRSLYKKLVSWVSQETKSSEVVNHQESRIKELTEGEPREAIEFLPKLKSRSALLQDTEVIREFIYHLPKRLWFCDWHLLYGTRTHGISLNTFYTKLNNAGPNVVLIEDSKGYIFGGFASDWWRVEPNFYGTGESFLFQLKPRLEFYPWTEKNSNFMCSRKDFIAMGGGGHFGLWIDPDFDNGSSGVCETFGNPILSSTEDFKVAVMEVWGFSEP